MNNFAQNSVYFGVFITLITYGLGIILKRKFKLPIFNPMVISILSIILILIVCKIDYENYYTSAKYLSYLLTPATVCLAIPLYNQFERLKHNWKAVIAGITSGVLTSLICIYVMSLMFGLNHAQYVTLLPKSITNAIAVPISEELGGYVTITIAVIVITGVFGNMIAHILCKIFRISEPIAKGVAIGTSSHAFGTVKAMEMGETEGAMSSLSIAVAGILTVIFVSLFAQFI